MEQEILQKVPPPYNSGAKFNSTIKDGTNFAYLHKKCQRC
jgi:hypothetical protein